MNKVGEFNFVWIFAIMAGAAILVLAIYGAVNMGDGLQYGTDTEAAKSISILLNPLEAGFAEKSSGKIIFKQETRLNNFCNNIGFGENEISVSSRSRLDDEWSLSSTEISVKNKYIFSDEAVEGKEYHVLSAPFNFPYKVADMVFLSSERYCFVGAEALEDDIVNMSIENIVFGEANCSDSDVKVCFGGGNCDVAVYGYGSGSSTYDYGTVLKRGGGEVDYVGNLMWGAIFADEYIYECNVDRLLYRAKSIAGVFANKADLMDARDCETGLKDDLGTWVAQLSNYPSENLFVLRSSANNLDEINDGRICSLW